MAKEGAIKAIILILGNGLNVAAYSHSNNMVFSIFWEREAKKSCVARYMNVRNIVSLVHSAPNLSPKQMVVHAHRITTFL